MPPRTIYHKEAVTAAAYALVRQQGLAGLTVRHVARELGSSTAPVYSVFRSMDGLEQEVIARAMEMLLDYATRPHTELVFLNMGVGICMFAREEQNLFRALFLESAHIKANIEKLLDALVEGMLKDERVAFMSRSARMALLTKMWIYTHGLATMICLGVAEDSGDAFIIQSIAEVGRVVIEAALKAYQDGHTDPPVFPNSNPQETTRG